MRLHEPVLHSKSIHASSSLLAEQFGFFLGKMHVMMSQQGDTSSAETSDMIICRKHTQQKKSAGKPQATCQVKAVTEAYTFECIGS